MANSPVQQTSSTWLANLSMGPKILLLGAVLFVLTRIITWLPLDWVDGPLLGLLWLGIIGCLVVGGGLTVMKSKRS